MCRAARARWRSTKRSRCATPAWTSLSWPRSGAPCEALRDAGVRVLSLGQPELLQVWRHPGAALRSAWNSAAFAATRALLARQDPASTVVHLHGYTKALSTSPALAARLAGFSTVCTLHDFFAACPNGAFYDYQREEPCRGARCRSPAC